LAVAAAAEVAPFLEVLVALQHYHSQWVDLVAAEELEIQYL
jgi:hypothetical protein